MTDIRMMVATLLDYVVSSMDYGSGFLCDEEVEVLREAAVMLNRDPMTVTPNNHRCKYVGHEWSHRRDREGYDTDDDRWPRECRWCSAVEFPRPATCPYSESRPGTPALGYTPMWTCTLIDGHDEPHHLRNVFQMASTGLGTVLVGSPLINPLFRVLPDTEEDE